MTVKVNSDVEIRDVTAQTPEFKAKVDPLEASGRFQDTLSGDSFIPTSKLVENRLQEIKKEMEKSNNFRQIWICYQVMIISGHQSENEDHKELFRTVEIINVFVIGIMDTHNRISSVALIITNSVICIGAGLCGVSGLTGNLLFSSANTINKLLAASTPISTLGSSFGQLSKIPDASAESERTGLNAEKEKGNAQLQYCRTHLSREQEKQNTNLRQLQSIQESNHRDIASFT